MHGFWKKMWSRKGLGSAGRTTQDREQTKPDVRTIQDPDVRMATES